MTAPVTAALPTLPVHAIEASPMKTPWLIQQLWGAAAVGVIGGVPKVCKSWLGLELAVSVASGTACLGRFPVENPGPVVVYLAEDALSAVRDRIDQLCQHRGLTLARLDLHVVTAPSLRLDLEDDRRALDQTLALRQPRMLLLDPLVRLHRLDENSAADIAGLLGFLRELNRRHDVAIVLVHHMGKRPRQDLGQALRGSSDVHAWTDSACYLMPRRQQLRLTVQHRAAAAPDPMLLRFVSENGQPCRLQLDEHDAEPPPLAEAVRARLRDTDRPCSRTDLRQQLRVNNTRLGEALSMLEQLGLVVRGPSGWSLTAAPDDLPLTLSQ